MTVSWDYSALAAHYDKRAEYDARALDRLIEAIGAKFGTCIAEIGAGTGKLAVPLARRGFAVSAVEPNDKMCGLGISNSSGLKVNWYCASAEDTGLPATSFDIVTFGSSFNVVDRPVALREVARILRPRGWMACMWNHRDLDDPVQARVEMVIKHHIPGYSYGTRREDPAPAIAESGLFEPAQFIEGRFTVDMASTDYLEAWRSHATLHRQAGTSFTAIVEEIGKLLASGGAWLPVPYFTRIWYARLK